MIHVLDKLSIDQIAAGEVVERPLSVVKELVENAMDAGACAITVEIRGGGIDLIRVTDDGLGIDHSEVKTAFYRHATSKIRHADELIHVTSLGFRGEALSSIAAVARVELITRTHDSIIGTRYLIEGGDEQKIEEIGAPEGTTLIVRDLFFNTPARREFLKSPLSEGNAIRDYIVCFSLAHPDVRFHLIADGRDRVKTAGDHSLRSRIFCHFGSELTHVLIPIDRTEDDLKLTGFIAKPEFSRGNRSWMYYFVDGRPIESAICYAAIMDGYRGFLMSHRFPFTALMLTVPPEKLDINVHPTKKEVRFRDEKSVYELIYHAVSSVLSNINLIPEETPAPEQKIPSAKIPPLPDISKEQSSTFSGRYDSETARPVLVREKAPEPFEQKRIELSHEKTIPVPEEEAPELSIFHKKEPSDFRIIGQVFDTYWLVEYENRLLIIDQHAAHEKVLYERIVKRMKTKSALSQPLLAPIICSLSGRETEVLSLHGASFSELGFKWDDFGDREIRITAVPADFLDLDPKEVFLDMLGSLMNGQTGKKPEMILDHMATMACKAAVKGGHTMSVAEAKALIGEMLSLDEPYHCPHGRPTTIAMNQHDFEKKFKRIL